MRRSIYENYYEPKHEDIYTVLDLIRRGVITGLEWAGKDFTEVLVPWGLDDLGSAYEKMYGDEDRET